MAARKFAFNIFHARPSDNLATSLFRDMFAFGMGSFNRNFANFMTMALATYLLANMTTWFGFATFVITRNFSNFRRTFFHHFVATFR